MASETLAKLETILTKHEQRPCDFWDNIKRADWDRMLKKLSKMNIEQMETFLITDGYV